MKKQRLFSSVDQLENYLSKYIKSTIEQKKTTAWDRMTCFMSLLDNPQNKLNVIHVAGTSGKGSVSTIISNILKSHKLKVGLTVSPHIYDIRERLQLNGKLISINKLSYLFENMMPVIDKMNNSKYGAPSYFEIMIGAAYKFFYDEKVDFAVVETGLGGLLDATNIANSQNKTAVLTRIGYDHMDVLGNTISEITNQKAGIIHKNNHVFYLKNSPIVNKIIENKSKKLYANALKIDPKKYLKNIEFESNGISFEYSSQVLKNLKLFLPVRAKYQLENTTIALRVVEDELIKKSIKPNKGAIYKAVKNSYIPGRFEIIKINNKTIIFDGAHNPQKMNTFLNSLKTLYGEQKFDFLIAFKEGKDYAEMLNQIIPCGNKIHCTTFDNLDKGMLFSSISEKKLALKLGEMNFEKSKIFIEKKTIDFFQKWLKQNSRHILIVTGSLYLISDSLKYIKNIDQDYKSRN